MKKLLFCISAILLSVSGFAQTDTDTWTVNKKDGTSQSYKITGSPEIKFTDANTFGNLMKGFEDFGPIDSYNISDVNNITFSVAHQEKYDYSSVTLADASANAKAKQLYNYLKSVYGTKILSGVMAETNWNHNIADQIHTATGKYPAINGYDFIHIMRSGENWINYDNITPVTDWADNGGIVALMWHFMVPKTEANATVTNTTEYEGNVTYEPSETTFMPSNALKDGTWENKWFYGQMDKVIEVLLKLQDAGIAATWRPFHEAAGNAKAKTYSGSSWFWWGREGADVYKQLWQAMFTYFSQKGVHNLIWVWTAQNYNGDSNSYDTDTDWYPGDNYVDVVARDLYGNSAAQQNTEFTQLQTSYPGKMIALGECGTTNGTATADTQEAWNAGAKWSWFMGWCGNNLPSDSWWSAVLNEDNVITRDAVNQNVPLNR